MDSEPLIVTNETELQDPPPDVRPESNSRRKNKLITVEPIIAAVFLAYTLSGNVLTELFLKRTCTVVLQYNDSICNALGTETPEGRFAESLVQPRITNVLMVNAMIGSLVPALLSVFLGPWSDTNGRKPVIVMSIAGSTLMYAIYTVLAYVPNLPPAFLLMGIVPLSLLGGNVNMISAVLCYISDISSIESRAMRLGVVEGSIIGGVMIGMFGSPRLYAAGEAFKYGYLAIFGTCTIICFLMLLYAVFFITESVAISQNSRGFRDLFDIQHPIEMAKTFVQRREGGKRVIVYLSVFCLASSIFILEGEAQITYLFVRLQFQWTLKQFMDYSIIIMVVTIFGIAMGCWFFGKYFKLSDALISSVAYFANVFQNLLFALARSSQTYLLYVAGGVGVLRLTVGPLARSIVSKSVPTSDLGKIFSLIASMEATVPLISAPVYLSIYHTFIPGFPGAPFLVSAFIHFLCFSAVGVIFYIQKKNPD